MNPYYIPRGEPPITNLLHLAQVALTAYNAGLLGGEPARMAKAQREAMESETALAQVESEAKYGGGVLRPPEVTSGYDYTTAPQGVVNLPGAGAAVLGRKPGLEERGMRLREETLGVQRGGLELDKQTLEQRKQEFNIQQKLESPVSAGEFAAMQAGLAHIDEQLGFGFSKAAPGYINILKNKTDQGVSRRGLYEYSRENWDYLKKPFMEAAEKEMATAVKNHDMQKVAQLKKTIDLMAKPEFLDMFYPMCAKAREAEKATTAKQTDLLLRAQLGKIDDQVKAIDDDMNRVEIEIAKLDPELDTEAVNRLNQEKDRLLMRRQALYGYKKALGGQVPEEFLATPQPKLSLDELVKGVREDLGLGAKEDEKTSEETPKKPPEEAKKPVPHETAMKLLRAAQDHGRIPKRDDKTWKLKLQAYGGDVWRLIEAEERQLAAFEGIRTRGKEQIQQSLGAVGKKVRKGVQEVIRKPEAEAKPWYAK